MGLRVWSRREFVRKYINKKTGLPSKLRLNKKGIEKLLLAH